jgi:hypothetical protein
MEKDSTNYFLALTIEDIQLETAALLTHLQKSDRMAAPARRARVSSIKLTKLLKAFRKLSCEAGLK